MIELQNINKSYGTVKALKDISLFIQEGEIFGIIGKSGAGKSTLLRTINRLDDPDSGDIIIDNQYITSIDSKALLTVRHKIAMIFQHFNLLNSKTVFENIALPMRIQGYSDTEIQQKIDELLPVVELQDKKDSYPSSLSGGQKQRVAIARAITCAPKILLCDEATSALDPETTEAILTLLKKINALYGITIVLITHEMDVVKRICHRVAVMERGELIETVSLSHAFNKKNSIAGQLLFAQLTPQIPPCLLNQITSVPNQRPLLRVLFQGREATVPFISQTSRELGLDINILLANIDRFDTITCGVMVLELLADETALTQFIDKCVTSNLSVEVLGYVTDTIN